jgi:hypothetical protein
MDWEDKMLRFERVDGEKGWENNGASRAGGLQMRQLGSTSTTSANAGAKIR